MVSLRSLIIRKAAIVFLVVLAAGLVLAVVSGGWESVTQLGWAVALSAGIAAFSGWQTVGRMKKGVIDAILVDFRLVPVDRAQWPKADWQAIDDFSLQLEARGYTRLGDYTSNASQAASRGFARFLTDPKGIRLVEIQHFERVRLAQAVMGDEHFRLHFSMTSVVGGRIRVQVTDRPVHPSFWVLRGDEAVAASWPGASLLELVEKHGRLAGFVASRTAKAVDTGFTLDRYVALERERFAAVKHRLAGRSGWSIVADWDAFVADPRDQWAPDEAHLRDVPARSWSEVDAMAPAWQAAGPEAADTVGDPALRERMKSGAHWFYWIAGLSLVNAIASAMGSQWGFVIGLGVTQVLSAIAGVATEGGDAGSAMTALALAINAAVIAAFFLVGWLATRPSVAAFAIGIAVFALDSLIFLVAGDWIGVAFHGLALYFLWSGLQAARSMKCQPAATPAG